MATLTMKKPRKGAQYLPEEQTVINVFKEDRSQTTSKRHGHICKSKELPAIFDYWAQEGPGSILDEEVQEHVKVSLQG